MTIKEREQLVLRRSIERCECRICLSGLAFVDHPVVSSEVASPRRAHMADLDADGDLDLVYASTTKLGWIENTDGAGTFGTAQQIGDVQSSGLILTDDLDGDADLDVLVSVIGDHRLLSFENVDGQGTFGPAKQLLLTGGRRYPLLVDLDGDGDRDLVGADRNRDLIEWYENEGGAFEPSPQELASNISANATPTAGDFDQDGDLDLFVVASDGTFLLENVEQAFHVRQIVEEDRYRSVQAADIDGDRDLDVLLADTLSATDKLFWLENLDGESFSQPILIAEGHSLVDAMQTVDLDNDGNLDVVLGTRTGHPITWLQNEGDGKEFIRREIAEDPLNWSSLALADVNGDGLTDVVYAAAPISTMGWFENSNQANAFAHRVITDRGSAKSKIILATDMDGDNDVDFLTDEIRRDQITWFENDPEQGAFERQQRAFEESSHLVMVDLSGDDILELVALPPRVVLSDLNGDGHLDLVRGHGTDAYVVSIDWYERFPRFGDRVFGPPRDVGTTGLSGTIATGDIDGDGDQDVVSFNASRIDWYENIDGLGEFASRPLAGEVDSPATPLAGVLTDLDNDGDLDVVYTPRRQLTWHENLGTGDFGPAQSIELIGEPDAALVATDLNGDLRADFLISLTTAYPKSVLAWYEFQEGAMTLRQTLATNIAPIESIITVDVDGDSDLDILYSSELDSTFGWFESRLTGDTDHDGDVDFQDLQTLIAHFGAQKVNWDLGDFNSDREVTFQDFILLAENYGRSRNMASAFVS